jgi:hypothetical protein
MFFIIFILTPAFYVGILAFKFCKEKAFRIDAEGRHGISISGFFGS